MELIYARNIAVQNIIDFLSETIYEMDMEEVSLENIDIIINEILNELNKKEVTISQSEILEFLKKCVSKTPDVEIFSYHIVIDNLNLLINSKILEEDIQIIKNNVGLEIQKKNNCGLSKIC